MSVPPKIRGIEKRDRRRIKAILEAQKHLKAQEAQLALKLIDAALTQP